MDKRNLLSNKENCILAARISAIIGIITSVTRTALSLVTIVKKKRGESVSKGATVARSVLMVFAVAGAFLGTLLSNKAIEED